MAELTQQDLPLWMQKALRGTDWGVLIVLVLSIAAACPFLLQPGISRTNATEHYVYRAADTAQAFSEGRLYLRWSPNALVGYGAPIPEYYPPGAAYVSALLDVLLTDDPVLAVKLVFAGALCLAGAAVYAFVTRRSGAAAGVIAALLYVYSPYVGLTAPQVLGDLPGAICLMLIPALLWSVDRLLRHHRPVDQVYVALITGALLLTNLPAALVGGLIAAALVAWSNYRRWVPVLVAGGLGIGLAACYWLPALAEADAVNWYSRLTTLTANLTPLDLVTPLRPLDPGALIQTPQFTLGVALMLATLASLPVIVRRRSGFHALFLILGAGLTVAALAIFPQEVWLLGVISLCLSVGASAVVEWNKTALFPAVIAVAILVLAAPIWLAPRSLASAADAQIDSSPEAQVEYELAGFGIAALPDGDPLPATIPPDTAPSRALLSSYRAGLVSKVEPDARAQIGVLEHDSESDRLQVQTFAPLTLRVLTAYFPGWSARLNDTPLPLARADDGLMSVSVPDSTRGELAIWLDTTAPRTLGWLISGLALALIAANALLRSRRSSGDVYEALDLLPAPQARLLALVCGAFVMVMIVAALPMAPLPVQAQPDYALAGSVPLDDSSDAGLEALAYRLDGTQFRPGDTLHLTLYWHTLRFLTESYRVRDLAARPQQRRLPRTERSASTRRLPDGALAAPLLRQRPAPDFAASRFSGGALQPGSGSLLRRMRGGR